MRRVIAMVWLLQCAAAWAVPCGSIQPENPAEAELIDSLRISRAHLRQCDLAGAKQAFSEVPTAREHRVPIEVRVLEQEGLLHLASHHFDDARVSFERMLELASEACDEQNLQAEADLYLIDTLYFEGKVSASALRAESGLFLSSRSYGEDFLRYAERLARARALQDQPSAALDQLQLFSSDVADSAPAIYPQYSLLLADLLIAMGRRGEARSIIATVLDRPVEAETRKRIEVMVSHLDRLDGLEPATSLDELALAAGAENSPAIASDMFEQVGLLYQSRADPIQGLQAFRRALELLESSCFVDPGARARLSHDIGLMLAELGEVRRASEHFDRAIRTYDELGARTKAATSKFEKGLMLVNSGMRGHEHEAVALGESALTELESHDPSDYRIGLAHSTLAHAHFELNDFEQAQGHVSKALERMRASGIPEFNLVPGLLMQAKLALLRRDVGSAREFTVQAIRIRRETESVTPRGLADALHVAVDVELFDGAFDTALRYSEEMLRIMKRRLWFARNHLGFFALGEQARWKDLIASRMQVLLAQHRDADAAMFESLQMVHELNTASTYAQASAMRAETGSLQKREQYRSLERRLFDPEVPAETRRFASAQLSAILEQIGDQSVLTQSPQNHSLSDVQSMLAPDEVLLIYGSFADWLITAKVTRSSQEFRKVEVDEESLSRLVRAVRTSARFDQGKPAGPFDTDTAAELYRILVAPLMGDDVEGQHVLVIPHAVLQSLPFEVLVSRSWMGFRTDYFGLRNTISYMPSVSSLVSRRRDMSRSRAANPFFAMYAARPAEVATEQLLRSELIEIAQRFQLSPEEGVVDGLSFQDRKADLADYRVLVFATHGYLLEGASATKEPGLLMYWDPESSREPFDQEDGFLTTTEIFSLGLDADVVVLPACDSGAGDGSPGEAGLSGMARAFFGAGARSLVVSHWKSHAETAMRFTSLVLEHADVDLAGAALNARRTAAKEFPHPAYWGPFVVVGE